MVKNVLAEPEVQQAVIEERAELAEMCQSKAREVIVSIDADTIAKGNLLQKSTSAAILLDKAAMLRGDAPPVANIHVLLECVEAIKARRDQSALPTIEARVLLPET